jgi:hypothetical protein
VTDKPSRKFYSPTPKFGAAKEQELTTRPPPFDIEAFARETIGPDSDRRSTSEPIPRRRSQLKEPEPDSASALLRTIEDSPVSSRAPQADDERIAALRASFSFGDYAGALTIADLILVGQPDNLLARDVRAKCRTTLEDVYALRLGPLDRTPVVAMLPKLTRQRPIDTRTGFLLSLIDGSSTLEAILDVCGQPRLDALRILDDLVKRGIVAFE